MTKKESASKGKDSFKYLKSISFSRCYPWKICVVARSKKLLWEILDDGLEGLLEGFAMWAKRVDEKRSGWCGFLYYTRLKPALKFREKYYDHKSCYVFLQHDEPIIKYYSKERKKARRRKDERTP